jgi:Ca2+-binding EF-hand superfamily protein
VERKGPAVVENTEATFKQLVGFDVSVFEHMKSQSIAAHREMKSHKLAFGASVLADLEEAKNGISEKSKTIEAEIARFQRIAIGFVGGGEKTTASRRSAKRKNDDDALDSWVYKMSPELRAQIPVQTLAHLQKRFVATDTDGNGTIDSEEFRVMSTKEFGQSKAKAAETFQKYDSDGDGVLNFEEFIKCVLPIVYPKHRYFEEKEETYVQIAEEKKDSTKSFTNKGYLLDNVLRDSTPAHIIAIIETKFFSVDTNSSGLIDFNEFHVLYYEQYGYSKAQSRREFSKWDADGSGELDFNEFVKCMLPIFVANSDWKNLDFDSSKKVCGGFCLKLQANPVCEGYCLVFWIDLFQKLLWCLLCGPLLEYVYAKLKRKNAKMAKTNTIVVAPVPEQPMRRWSLTGYGGGRSRTGKYAYNLTH